MAWELRPGGCSAASAMGGHGRAFLFTAIAITMARSTSSKMCLSRMRRLFDVCRLCNSRSAGNSIRFGLARMIKCNRTGSPASSRPPRMDALSRVIFEFVVLLGSLADGHEFDTTHLCPELGLFWQFSHLRARTVVSVAQRTDRSPLPPATAALLLVQARQSTASGRRR